MREVVETIKRGLTVINCLRFFCSNNFSVISAVIFCGLVRNVNVRTALFCQPTSSERENTF